MNIWSRVPFLRLLFPFVAGIIAAIYSPYEWRTEFEKTGGVIIFLFVLTCLYVFLRQLQVNYFLAPFFGFFILLLIFCSGYLLVNLNTQRFRNNHFSNYSGSVYFARCIEPYLEKEKSFKVIMEILGVKENGTWKRTIGKAICYFRKDSLSAQLTYGDCMLIATSFQPVKHPQNPGEFNYRQFLSFHNIWHQAYVSSENWKKLNQNIGNPIMNYAHETRTKLLSVFKENNVSGDEFAVGAALVLGYDDKVDQDIISAYASSGALHVLSVSGLHVGIIYVFANFVLTFFDKFRFTVLAKIFILLLVLWSYAVFTGLSPSVLRSAAMFSIIAVAKGVKYDTNIFNTLAVACFVLLMLDPYLIMQVGFQLSFLAVLGIVSIHPWLYEKWQPKAEIVNYLWGLISVSVAAQATTFPLGLLYFHQFPNYFLFSNLIVIPLSAVILIYGLFVLMVGKIAVIGPFCAKLFSWMVWVLNESVRMIEGLPGAIMEGISISIAETWMIYALICCLVIFLFYRRKNYLEYGLFLFAVLLSLQVYENYKERKQRLLVIYNVPKATAINFVSGKKCFMIADSSLLRNKSQMLFHVKHHLWDSGIEKEIYLERENLRQFTGTNVIVKNNFMQFGNKRLVVIDSSLPYRIELSEKFYADYLVLSRNANVKIGDLQRFFSFNKVIIDSSNFLWKSNKWKKECEEMKVECYSVIDSGAYLEELL